MLWDNGLVLLECCWISGWFMSNCHVSWINKNSCCIVIMSSRVIVRNIESTIEKSFCIILSKWQRIIVILYLPILISICDFAHFLCIAQKILIFNIILSTLHSSFFLIHVRFILYRLVKCFCIEKWFCNILLLLYLCTLCRCLLLICLLIHFRRLWRTIGMYILNIATCVSSITYPALILWLPVNLWLSHLHVLLSCLVCLRLLLSDRWVVITPFSFVLRNYTWSIHVLSCATHIGSWKLLCCI